jgi:hypothetical protein
MDHLAEEDPAESLGDGRGHGAGGVVGNVEREREREEQKPSTADDGIPTRAQPSAPMSS